MYVRANTPFSLDNKPKTTKTRKSTPIAAIRTIEAEPSLQEELYSIESDPRLQVIIEKQETEQALSEAEVLLFNELMERHQEITSQLGLDDENTEECETKSEASEDDLWDKFDSSDLSDYQ